MPADPATFRVRAEPRQQSGDLTVGRSGGVGRPAPSADVDACAKSSYNSRLARRAVRNATMLGAPISA
jgi:hypothetical protein